MVKRILVGLGDEAHAESATRYGIELAVRTDAELTGIALFDEARLSYTGSVPLGAGDFARELREKRLLETRELVDRLITAFESACRESQVPALTTIREGEPLDCLQKAARYQDIVFAGRTSLFEHGVIEEPPSALIELIQGGVRPIVTVPAEYRPIRKVIVAYSGSMGSARTMRQFAVLRPWPDAKVQIVVFDKKEDESKSLLTDAVAYYEAHGIDVEGAYVPDPPLHSLLPYAAKWDADMIVMGNSARRYLLRKVFGETMLHAVKNSEIPLFLSQ